MKSDYQKSHWRVVDWIDSINAGGWRDGEEEHEPVMCRSIGIVLKETETYITLAQTVGDDGNYANVVTIPKVSVTGELHVRLKE